MLSNLIFNLRQYVFAYTKRVLLPEEEVSNKENEDQRKQVVKNQKKWEKEKTKQNKNTSQESKQGCWK